MESSYRVRYEHEACRFMSHSLLDCFWRLEPADVAQQEEDDFSDDEMSSTFLLQNILRFAFFKTEGQQRADGKVMLAYGGHCCYRPFPCEVEIEHLLPQHSPSAARAAFNSKSSQELDSIVSPGCAEASRRRKTARVVLLHNFFHQLKIPISKGVTLLAELFRFLFCHFAHHHDCSVERALPRLWNTFRFWSEMLPSEDDGIAVDASTSDAALSDGIDELDESVYLHAVLAAHVLPRLHDESGDSSTEARLTNLFGAVMRRASVLGDPILASFVTLLVDLLPVKCRRELWGSSTHCSLLTATRGGAKSSEGGIDDSARLFDEFCLLRCPSTDGANVYGALRMAESQGKYAQRNGTVFTTSLSVPRRYTTNDFISFVPREVNNPQRRFIRRLYDPPSGPDSRAKLFGDVLSAVNLGPSPQVFYFEVCVMRIGMMMSSAPTTTPPRLAIGVGRNISLLRNRDATKLLYGRKIYALVNGVDPLFSPSSSPSPPSSKRQRRHFRHASFGIGDIVGCGVYRNRLFFTLNGAVVREQSIEMEMPFVPFIDLPGQAVVRVNFGDDPYVFDLRLFLAVSERLFPGTLIRKVSSPGGKSLSRQRRDDHFRHFPVMRGSELSLPVVLSVLDAGAVVPIPPAVWNVVAAIPSRELLWTLTYNLLAPISKLLVPRHRPAPTTTDCSVSSDDVDTSVESICDPHEMRDMRDFQRTTSIHHGSWLTLFPAISKSQSFRRFCCSMVEECLREMIQTQQGRARLGGNDAYVPELQYVYAPYLFSSLPFLTDWILDEEEEEGKEEEKDHQSSSSSSSSWSQFTKLLCSIGKLLVPSSLQHDATLFCCVVSCIQQILVLQSDRCPAKALALLQLICREGDVQQLGPGAELVCAVMGANTLELVLLPGDFALFQRREGSNAFPSRVISADMIRSKCSMPDRGSPVMPQNVLLVSSTTNDDEQYALAASRLIVKRRLNLVYALRTQPTLLEFIVSAFLRLLRQTVLVEEKQYDDWTAAGRRASESARLDDDDRFSHFHDDLYGRSRVEQLCIAQDHFPVSWFQWAVTAVLTSLAQGCDQAKLAIRQCDLISTLCSKWFPPSNPLRFMWNYENCNYSAVSADKVCLVQLAFSDLLHHRSETALRRSSLLFDLLETTQHRVQVPVGTKRVWLSPGAKLNCNPCLECGRILQPMFAVHGKSTKKAPKSQVDGYCAACILGIPILTDITNKPVKGPQKRLSQLPRKIFLRCACCNMYLTSQLDSFAVEYLKLGASRWSKREKFVDMCVHCSIYNVGWYNVDPDSAIGGCSFEDFHPLVMLSPNDAQGGTKKKKKMSKDWKKGGAKKNGGGAGVSSMAPFAKRSDQSRSNATRYEPEDLDDDLQDDDEDFLDPSSYSGSNDDSDLSGVDSDSSGTSELDGESLTEDEVARSPWNLARELLNMLDFDSFTSSMNFVLFRLKHTALVNTLNLIGRASSSSHDSDEEASTVLVVNELTRTRVSAILGAHWPYCSFLPNKEIAASRVFLQTATETMHTLVFDDSETPQPFGCVLTLAPGEVARLCCAAASSVTLVLIQGAGDSLSVASNRFTTPKTPFILSTTSDFQLAAENDHDVLTFRNHHSEDMSVVYCRFFRLGGTPRDDVPTQKLLSFCSRFLLSGLSTDNDENNDSHGEMAAASTLLFALSPTAAQQITPLFWVDYFPLYISRLFELGIRNVLVPHSHITLVQHIITNEVSHRQQVFATCFAWGLLDLCCGKKSGKMLSRKIDSSGLHLREGEVLNRLAYVPMTFSLSNLAVKCQEEDVTAFEPFFVAPTMISTNFDVDTTIEMSSDNRNSVTVIPEIVGERSCVVTTVSSCYAMNPGTGPNTVTVDFCNHPSFSIGIRRCVVNSATSSVSECMWSATGHCRDFDGKGWECLMRASTTDISGQVKISLDLTVGVVSISLTDMPTNKSRKNKKKRQVQELRFVFPRDNCNSASSSFLNLPKSYCFLVVQSSQEFTVDFDHWALNRFPKLPTHGSPMQSGGGAAQKAQTVPSWDDPRDKELQLQLSVSHRKLERAILKSGGVGVDELPLECAMQQLGVDKPSFTLLRVLNNCLTSSVEDMFLGFPLFRDFVQRFAKRLILLTSPLRRFIARQLQMKAEQQSIHAEYHARPVVVVDRLHRQQQQLLQQHQHPNTITSDEDPKIRRKEEGGQPHGATILDQVAHQLFEFSSAMDFFVSDERWFDVELVGEGGGDAGGPFREVQSAITAELFSMHEKIDDSSSNEHLFLPTPNTRQQNGSEIGAFFPSPKSERHDLFYFLGKMMAGCIYCRSAKMSFNLSSLCWKFLADEPIDANETTIGAFDWQLVKSLTTLRSLDAETLASLCLTDDDGNAVNSHDSLGVFISKKLSSVVCESFSTNKALWWLRKGLHEMIPRDVMLFLNGALLEFYVCGASVTPTADDFISRMSIKSESSVSTKGKRAIESFKSAVRFLGQQSTTGDDDDAAELVLLLQFWTAHSRFPVPSLFLEIDENAAPDVLPTSRTCFYELTIPAAVDADVGLCLSKLRQAIHHCVSIDRDFDPHTFGA